MEEGLFRRDLLFRINVVTLKIPPLRERTEDIPLLIDIALDRFNQRYGKKIRGFSSEALQILLNHTYPGNVRELLNIVEQTVILCRGGEIGVDQLPEGFSAHSRPEEPAPVSTTGSLTKEGLAELLTRHNGNRSQVARELGLNPSVLWQWANASTAVPSATDRSTGETLEQEVRRLRREVAILKQEREFAKKAAAFFARESR